MATRRRPVISWLLVIGTALVAIVIATITFGRRAAKSLPVPESADAGARIEAASIPPDARMLPLVAKVVAADVVVKKTEDGTDSARRIDPDGCPVTAFALRRAIDSDVYVVTYRDKAPIAFTGRVNRKRRRQQ